MEASPLPAVREEALAAVPGGLRVLAARLSREPGLAAAEALTLERRRAAVGAERERAARAAVARAWAAGPPAEGPPAQDAAPPARLYVAMDGVRTRGTDGEGREAKVGAVVPRWRGARTGQLRRQLGAGRRVRAAPGGGGPPAGARRPTGGG